MALTKKDLLFSALYLASGLFLLEVGILSVLTALAYREYRGSPMAATAGIVLIFAGGFLLIRSKRRLQRSG